MAGPFDNQNPETMTPGSAVADTLQNILANKRAVARQQMLDDLNRQNVQSEMAYRQQQAQSEADYRQQQAETNRIYREGIADQRHALAAEEQEKAGRREATMKSLNAFKQSPSYTSMTPSQRAAFDILAADPSDQGVRALMTEMVRPSKPNMVDAYAVTPDGRFIKAPQQVPAGSIIRDLPQAPAPAQDVMWLGGPKGEHIPYIVDRRNTKPGAIPVPPEYASQGYTWSGMGNNPAPGRGRDLSKSLYDEKAYGRYQTALRSTGANAGQARASAMNDLLNSVSDPLVKADVQGILNNPISRKMSYDDLISSGALSGDDDHLNNVKTVLGLIRGQ